MSLWMYITRAGRGVGVCIAAVAAQFGAEPDQLRPNAFCFVRIVYLGAGSGCLPARGAGSCGLVFVN